MEIELPDHYKSQLEEFNSTSVEMLLRNDIGSLGFIELDPKLKEINGMLNECLAVILFNPSIPQVYLDQLFLYISSYNSHGKNLLIHNPEGINSQQQKRSRINEVEEFYKFMLTGIDIHNQRPDYMSFIDLYNTLKQKQLNNISSTLADANKIKTEFEQLKVSSDELLRSLQSKAKEISLHDYSQVFSNQSKVHSNRDKGKIGNAQRWMIATVLMVIVFICVVAWINKIYPISDNAGATVITIEYITRVLIISFVIYAISFCTKQYNIQKHLATVNKHRENTLNSYKLFIDSLGNTSSGVKDALMMEVAKAIYESGQTGYLGRNDKSETSPSMIELTKYVRGDKG